MSQKSSKTPELLSARDQLHRLVLLFRRAKRHWLKAALIVGIGAVLSLAFAITRPRVYLSETVIIYRQVIRSSYLGGGESQVESSKDVGLRMRELLLARPRLKKVIDHFKLYPKLLARRGYVEAVDHLRKLIEYRVGGGDTFHIAFKGPSPEIAQAVTKALADSLIEEEFKLRSEQVSATQRFLEAEATRIQSELQKKERQLAEFLAEHPEFAQEQVSGRGEGNAAGASIRAAQLRSKSVARRGDSTVLALKRQADRIRSQLTQGHKVVNLPPDPQLVAAKEAAEEDLREAHRVLSNKQTAFTEKHPDVVAAKARLASAQARVTRMRKALASSRAVQRPATEVDIQALKTELASIERQIASARRNKGSAGDAESSESSSDSTANSIVALETDWTRLNRQVREARERYVRLEARQFRASLEASSEMSGQAAQMRIIDPAYKPNRPAGVGRTMVLTGGMAVSIVVALLFLLGLALVDERIYDRIDIERLDLAEVLVEIPAQTKSEARASRRAARREAKRLLKEGHRE